MLSFFRSFFRSKFGAAIAIAVLVLIAFAFASGDVANTGAFGGIAGGNRVATVGDERIDTSVLSQAATSALERVKQDDPTMSMKAFIANGGLDDVLDDMIARVAIASFGKRNGIIASDRLVDSEIATMPAFQGADGKFSQDAFRQMMQQRGIGENLLREDIRQGLIARQVMVPAGVGAVMPKELAKRYAALLTERREGEIAVLPSVLFEPKNPPTDKQIADYYAANQTDFIRPERRVLRYTAFDSGVVKNVPEPSDAEVAFRYNANKDRYAASERRQISQVIVPTQAAAKAVVDEVRKGASLDRAAKEKGLAVADLEFFSKGDLAGKFSQAVADAAFAAASGGIAEPARSDLGWHVIRIDAIDRKPARSLADVRDELAKEIAAEKKRVALNEALDRIEDEFGSGSSLGDVAKSLGLEIHKTKPITADGKIYLTPDEMVPEKVKPILQTAFTMEAEQPQLSSIDGGAGYVVFDVTDIQESAPAPLAEIKDNVTAAYVLAQGSAGAKAAAEKVQAEIRKGATLQKALAALKQRVPPPQPVRMTRPELTRMQQQGQQVPPPLALLFSMAEGTVKVQPAPGKRGWFIVSLKDIEPGKIKDDDPLLQSARRELGQVAGGEYSQALQDAIRAEIGVERNEAGIRAVREQLGGGS